MHVYPTIVVHYSLRYPSLPFFTLCYPSLPFFTLCYPVLPFVTLRYYVSPFITLYLSFITLYLPGRQLERVDVSRGDVVEECEERGELTDHVRTSSQTPVREHGMAWHCIAWRARAPTELRSSSSMTTTTTTSLRTWWCSYWYVCTLPGSALPIVPAPPAPVPPCPSYRERDDEKGHVAVLNDDLRVVRVVSVSVRVRVYESQSRNAHGKIANQDWVEEFFV